MFNIKLGLAFTICLFILESNVCADSSKIFKSQQIYPSEIIVQHGKPTEKIKKELKNEEVWVYKDKTVFILNEIVDSIKYSNLNFSASPDYKPIEIKNNSNALENKSELEESQDNIAIFNEVMKELELKSDSAVQDKNKLSKQEMLRNQINRAKGS